MGWYKNNLKTIAIAREVRSIVCLKAYQCQWQRLEIQIRSLVAFEPRQSTMAVPLPPPMLTQQSASSLFSTNYQKKHLLGDADVWSVRFTHRQRRNKVQSSLWTKRVENLSHARWGKTLLSITRGNLIFFPCSYAQVHIYIPPFEQHKWCWRSNRVGG